jgi:1-phosphofructokinase family hexose kinase
VGLLLTVTPNPSIDFLFEAERLVWDDANRLAMPRRRAGGQGINLARAAVALGGEAMAVAPLGGRTGRELRAMLEQEALPLAVVPIAGETRVFVGVRERAGGRALLLNPRGPQLDAADADRLLDTVARVISEQVPAWVATCGSLPPGVGNELYARVGAIAREAGSRFVPDADGEALHLAAAGGCDLLVPNRHEAERLLGRPIGDVAAAALAARTLLRHAPLAAVTLGEAGAVAADAAGAWHARPPAMDGGSAVGAGDAFLAGLIVALEDGAPTPDALRAAVAAGTATLLSQAAELLKVGDAEAVSRRVEVRRA